MIYSYTQISQYLLGPRLYCHRYLEGSKEKDPRAAMLFGRAFNLALGAYFRREDPGEVFFLEWSACKDQGLEFYPRDTWDRMLEQGIRLLIRFRQDDRVHVVEPLRYLQIKFGRAVGRSEFVAYIDAFGMLNSTPCLLEWKTSSARYAEVPAGSQAPDPQLVCYSWITGISEVARVVFVREPIVEIQYLRTTITEPQRQQFGRLVEDTIRRMDSAEFLCYVPSRRMAGNPRRALGAPRS